jgi:hypothetical protein
MPRKPKPQPDNPEQFKRFIEMAREVESMKARRRSIARSRGLSETSDGPNQLRND